MQKIRIHAFFACVHRKLNITHKESLPYGIRRQATAILARGENR
jgi:hypothetical protein